MWCMLSPAHVRQHLSTCMAPVYASHVLLRCLHDLRLLALDLLALLLG